MSSASARDGFEACAAGEREGLLRRPRRPLRRARARPARRSRGQTDVLPTGRNLATLDPRAIPTRAATRARLARGGGGGAPPSAGGGRLAAPDRHGPLGLADAALRRRGHRPCAGPHGRAPDLGPCLDPRDRLRDRAAAAARPPARRRDGPRLRRIPRHLSRPDRAARPGRPRRRRARARTTTGTSSPPRAGAARTCRASSAPRRARYGAGVAGAGARRRMDDARRSRPHLSRRHLPCLRRRRRGRMPMRAFRTGSSRPTPSCM